MLHVFWECPTAMSRYHPRVLVNHAGFVPRAGKRLVVDAEGEARWFSVVAAGKKGFVSVCDGPLGPAGSDLGSYVCGDFSSVTQPGTYRVRAGGNFRLCREIWSHPFPIADDAWDDALGKLVDYYRRQSCGPSRYGFNTPCHTDPIQRDDGGKAEPVPGGWHAAHDCTRECRQIQQGLFGLVGLARARPDLAGTLGLLEEIRWGNDYFLRIQDPAGFVYHGVSNTDYSNWQERDWWDCRSYALFTRPAQLFVQYNFITIQTLIADQYRDAAPDYAHRCLAAGRRCLHYASQRGDEAKTSFETGAAVLAGVHMYRVTGEARYAAFAREMANRLVSFLAPEGCWLDPVRDHDYTQYAPFNALGLTAAVQHLSDDPDAPAWRAALDRFVSVYVRHFGEANAFGILPYQVYPGQPPQSARTWDGRSYRYFIETNYRHGASPGYSEEGNWRTGNNAIVAGYGVAMLQAARLLEADWLERQAIRQLDWVMGVNPFDASMILGVGRNQPPTYMSAEVEPAFPDIAGAVLQGPVGDERDNPVLLGGYYPTCEYWMPAHSWTLWLMAAASSQSG